MDKTDPKFYLPSWIESNINCPITNIYVGTSLAANDGLSGMQNPDTSIPTHLVPEYPTLDNLYEFFVYVKTQDSSSSKKLDTMFTL